VRGLPAIPGLREFPELNVRTYVTLGGKPGIHFFSLDAANAAAVLGARLSYLLPYFPARMSSTRSGEWVTYESERLVARSAGARFRARYRPAGDVFEAAPGTLDFFLAERYCLYSVDRRGRIYRGEIHHDPWQLQAAELTIEANTMARPVGIDFVVPPATLHFVRQQDTYIWPIRQAR
jgi:uncharacterized protein YqjF (DUF2071 family)